VSERAGARLWNPRDAFAEVLRAQGERIDLARAALLIAAEEYPALDIAHYLDRLGELAREVAPRLEQARTAAERVSVLNRFLFGERGFTGNREHYEDPRNSFLNEVLDRGAGIPITLSLVYMEVARRAGVEVDGVGFPGHFLVKHGCSDERGNREPIVVDAFFGTVLTRAECQVRLAAVLGAAAQLRPELHLRKASAREILVRLLGNLKVLYVRSADFGRALACCERILLVVPDAPHELRDRGLVYEKLECFGAAAADLERFLELAPDDESAAAVRDRLTSLRPRVRQLH
jgi:regulator of sirC expression with transglutaminase-like and TPR domain